MTIHSEPRDPFATLRKFVRARSRGPESNERCELCGLAIPAEHRHLLEIGSRKIACSCDACAILFSSQAATKYRRVPRDIRLLTDFALTDGQWDELGIPINIAFLTLHGDSRKPAVYYPSPAGATESLLPMDSWRTLVDDNPALRSMEPEVEALLVSRITQEHEYYVAPIDECYKLVGLIRSKWRGFSGGTDVWRAIGEFFISLNTRSKRTGRIA